jgi:hypothetical protein
LDSCLCQTIMFNGGIVVAVFLFDGLVFCSVFN